MEMFKHDLKSVLIFLRFSFLGLQMLMEFSDDVVPLLIPAKGGGTQAVQVVLTSSEEDRDLFEVLLKPESSMMHL